MENIDDKKELKLIMKNHKKELESLQKLVDEKISIMLKEIDKLYDIQSLLNDENFNQFKDFTTKEIEKLRNINVGNENIMLSYVDEKVNLPCGWYRCVGERFNSTRIGIKLKYDYSESQVCRCMSNIFKDLDKLNKALSTDNLICYVFEHNNNRFCHIFSSKLLK